MPSAVAGSESLAPHEYEDRIVPRSEIAKSFIPQRKTTSNLILAIAAAVVLVSGTYDSIASKWMNMQVLPPCDGCEPRNFEGPWWQSFTMYLGEALCMVAYLVDTACAKRRNKPNVFDFPTSLASFNKPHCPRYWWILPTTIDFISSTAINYAMVFSQASVVQMLRNFNAVLTAFLTLVYLRVALRVHQYMGVSVLTAGLVMTGVYAAKHQDPSAGHKLPWLGIVFALGGTTLSAFQFVFEESLFRKYYASPLEAVGCQGVFGCIESGIMLLIAQLAGFEDVKGNFYMMGLGRKESTYIILGSVSYVVSISFFNAGGLMVTKLGSGLLRTVLYTARTFTVWVMELLLGWNVFNGLYFGGLLVIILGVLTYNYNYFNPRGSGTFHTFLTKPLLFWKVRDPDVLKAEALKAELKEEARIAERELEGSDAAAPSTQTGDAVKEQP